MSSADAAAERPLSNRIYGHVREFACGSFAGVGLILAGHPFDTIKVRLQSEGGYGRFKGPVDCLVTTLKQEKVFGLYKGAMGPLIGQGLVSSIQFGLYSQFLPLVQRDLNRKATLSEVWAAAFCTGSFMWVVVTPMEGVKTRLQVQYSETHTGVKNRYTGTVDCYRKVYNEYGIRGLYKGAIPTVVSRLCFSWYMWGYETSRRFLTSNSGDGKISPLATLVSGGVAGTVYWFSLYPFDVIKNKIMASPDSATPKYKGMIDCGRQIYRAEGWKGFTRGFSVCLLRSLPANATTFLFLEIAMKWC